MRKNRILAILLAAAMAFSTCACGASPSGSTTVTEGPSVTGTKSTAEPEKSAETPQPAAKSEKPAETQQPAAETEKPAATTQPTATPQSTSTPQPTSTPQSTEDPGKAFSVGKTLNNIYTNEFFGIGLTLDGNWVFSTQEEIEALNSESVEIADNESYQNALDNGTVYTDMMATAEDGLLSISATIEKLTVVNSLALDEESYIDAALGNNDFEGIFESMGVPLTVLEKGTAVVAGAEHPCIVIEGSVEGISLFEKIVPIKAGSYVLVITVCSVQDNILDELLGLFYAL